MKPLSALVRQPARETEPGRIGMWSVVMWTRHIATLAVAAAIAVVPQAGPHAVWTAAVIVFVIEPYNIALHVATNRRGRFPFAGAVIDPLLPPALAVVFPDIWVPALLAGLVDLSLLGLAFGPRISTVAAAFGSAGFAASLLRLGAEPALAVLVYVILAPALVVIMAAATEQERGLRRRLHGLVEGLDAIVWEADPHTFQFAFVSRSAEHILGYPVGDWLASPDFWSGHIHDEDRAWVVELCRSATEQGRNHEFVYRMVAADGRTVWLHDVVRVETDGRGRATRLRGLMVDVTDRRRAEDALRRSEEKYRELFENANDMVYTIDLEGNVTSMNRSCEALTGYARDELLGRSVDTIIAPEQVELARGMGSRKFAGGPPTVYEVELVTKDGRRVPVEVSSRLLTEDGKPVGIQGIVRDMTDRKRAEEALRESRRQYEEAFHREREAAERLRALDRMKTTFLEAVSHELRTPLTSILGFAYTLLDQAGTLTEASRQELVDRLVSNATKLERLLSDLLDLDKLRRGILAIHRRPVDLAELLERVVRDVEFADSDRVEIEAERVVAPVDAAKVERIVENLLANAVRHTPPGTKVWARVHPADGGVLLAIDDAGAGVPAAMRHQIFEPFAQGETRAHAPGVGIGLSLVARFAELHGGRAWVEDRPGGGASFRVFLPAEVSQGTSV